MKIIVKSSHKFLLKKFYKKKKNKNKINPKHYNKISIRTFHILKLLKTQIFPTLLHLHLKFPFNPQIIFFSTNKFNPIAQPKSDVKNHTITKIPIHISNEKNETSTTSHFHIYKILNEKYQQQQI